MHRTRVLYRTFWGVLLALLFGAVCVAGETAVGQSAPAEVNPNAIIRVQEDGNSQYGAFISFATMAAVMSYFSQ